MDQYQPATPRIAISRMAPTHNPVRRPPARSEWSIFSDARSSFRFAKTIGPLRVFARKAKGSISASYDYSTQPSCKTLAATGEWRPCGGEQGHRRQETGQRRQDKERRT